MLIGQGVHHLVEQFAAGQRAEAGRPIGNKQGCGARVIPRNLGQPREITAEGFEIVSGLEHPDEAEQQGHRVVA